MEISSSGIHNTSERWYEPSLNLALHITIVYVGSLYLCPLTTGILHRHLIRPMESGNGVSDVQFYFSHLFIVTSVPLLFIGYLNPKNIQIYSLWVWVIPTAIMFFELWTFASVSVLGSNWSAAVSYYFGSDWRVPSSVAEAVNNIAGMKVYIARTRFVAPFYGGMAYCFGAFASRCQLGKMVFIRGRI